MKRHLIALVALSFCAAAGFAQTNVSGAITTNATWTTAGSPYNITSDVTVNTGVTLTIQPGVTIKVADSSSLLVSGKLAAVGTSSQPIVFTTARSAPAAGAWKGIDFRSTSDPTSTVSYVNIDSGGWSAGRTMYIAGSSPHIDHVTISTLAGSAIWIDLAAAHPVIDSCTFNGGTAYGLYVTGGALEVRNTTITNFTNYAISVGPGIDVLDASNLTSTGNGGGAKNNIGYRGGNMGGLKHGARSDSRGTFLPASLSPRVGRSRSSQE
ncbi:MAG TPA: right-handed parallel beta-helix repeat-containing protein [Thermoanaerobaculia bacterium]|jgi:hypothetical protein